jgi:hypothetical protein
MFGELRARAGDERLHVWGIQPGKGGYKFTSWAGLELPAVAFFYTEGGIRAVPTREREARPTARPPNGSATSRTARSYACSGPASWTGSCEAMSFD